MGWLRTLPACFARCLDPHYHDTRYMLINVVELSPGDIELDLTILFVQSFTSSDTP